MFRHNSCFYIRSAITSVHKNVRLQYSCWKVVYVKLFWLLIYVTTGCDAGQFGRHQRFGETIILDVTKPLDYKRAVNMTLDMFPLKFRVIYKTTRLLWGISFPTWPIIAGPTLQCDFIRLSKGYYYYDRLSISRHQLLNLIRGVRRIAGAALGRVPDQRGGGTYTTGTINNFRVVSRRAKIQMVELCTNRYY
jgi:hypothetical protein